MAGLWLIAASGVSPVRFAIEIGGDEHYEVTKAVLWAGGFPMYSRVWNDQPPLFTALLGTLFKCCGPTIGVARTLALWFGLMLMAGLFLLLKKRHGMLAAWMGAICLLAAPMVLELSVSVMLEVPAIAIGLWALWPVDGWAENRRTYWLIVSGLVLAAALQTKLTAVIFAPALAIELLVGSKGANRKEWARDSIRNIAVWGGSAAAGFVMLGAILGSGYDQAWASHFSARAMQSSEANQLAFSPDVLLDHTEALWGAGAGLLVLALRRQWRRLCFPATLLVTVAAIHLVHRPWWNYYYLHFAVPLAWLTGCGIAELFKMAWSVDARRFFRPPFTALVGMIGGSLLLSLLATSGGARLISEIGRIRHLPKVKESALIAKMTEYAQGAHWVYTRSTIYPFHAGLLVIPELAVMPLKRFWSGEITDAQVLAMVKQYRPEQLLLDNSRLDANLITFAESEYTMVYEDSEHRLYVDRAFAKNKR